MRTSVLNTVLAVALVVGAACVGPDSPDELFDSNSGLARGANITPVPADTVAQVTATFNTGTLAYSYHVDHAPATAIDSIALYQVGAATAALPAQATAILCATVAGCTATSGTATLVGTNTGATIRTSIRAYGTQLVVFTTAQRAGAARGTMYPNP